MVWPSSTKCLYSGSRSSRSRRASIMRTRRARNASNGRYHSRSQCVCGTTTKVRLGAMGLSHKNVSNGRDSPKPAILVIFVQRSEKISALANLHVPCRRDEQVAKVAVPRYSCLAHCIDPPDVKDNGRPRQCVQVRAE